MDTLNKIGLKRCFGNNTHLSKRIKKESGEALNKAIQELSDLTGISENFIHTHIQEIKNYTYHE